MDNSYIERRKGYESAIKYLIIKNRELLHRQTNERRAKLKDELKGITEKIGIKILHNV